MRGGRHNAALSPIAPARVPIGLMTRLSKIILATGWTLLAWAVLLCPFSLTLAGHDVDLALATLATVFIGLSMALTIRRSHPDVAAGVLALVAIATLVVVLAERAPLRSAI